MSRPWIKLWTEILHDPKLSNLNNEQFGIFIKLLIIADEIDKDGLIPGHAARGGYSREDLAREVHTTNNNLNKLLAILGRKYHQPSTQLPITQRLKNGDILITNYEKRQRRKDSDTPEAVAERVKKHRENVTPL